MFFWAAPLTHCIIRNIATNQHVLWVRKWKTSGIKECFQYPCQCMWSFGSETWAHNLNSACSHCIVAKRAEILWKEREPDSWWQRWHFPQLPLIAAGSPIRCCCPGVCSISCPQEDPEARQWEHSMALHSWTQVGSPVPNPQLADMGMFNRRLRSRVFSASPRTGEGRSEFSPGHPGAVLASTCFTALALMVLHTPCLPDLRLGISGGK